jgi:hypothetical protein
MRINSPEDSSLSANSRMEEKAMTDYSGAHDRRTSIVSIGLHHARCALEIVMPSARLYFTASVEEQWRALVGPWLREQAITAWKNPKPTVILTPSRAESFYLRSRLVDEGVTFLGLRFWTPSDARKSLLADLLPETGAPTQAELRLLARACAEKLIRKSGSDKATLTSVIREPGAFLRAYDLLLGAGWDPAREGAVYGRDLAREFQLALTQHRIATQTGLHRELWKKTSSPREAAISNLLVVGFNATHWPLWDLLKATAFSAEEAVVALTEPRFFAEEIDQLWISSWEEVSRSEVIIPDGPTISSDDNPPFANLVESYEKGESSFAPADGLSFCVTPDLASHIRAVILQTLDYLKRDSCTRLGIVFPEANALALGVAEELRRLGIPLDDGTGAWTPGLFEKRCWQSWLALQEEPGAPALIAWLRACEAQGVSSGLDGTVSALDAAKVLENALGETLIDDLPFLARHFEENARADHAPAVADFLRHRIALPETATFADFHTLTRRALKLLGWEAYRARLRLEPPEWLKATGQKLTRRTFLEWLRESTDSQTRTRGADGNHFYGKVHLLIYAQMTGQTWSHLILTGLNEGVWPRLFETGAFGSRHELIALNAQARSLNQLGAEQGGQGMGHETVSSDHGHCLLPLERQDLALRDLCTALESTSEAACLTALTTEEGRSLLPNDFFNHAYQSQTGHVLDEEKFQRMANATRDWCRSHDSLFTTSSSTAASSIASTQIAYAARRDASQPFGPYEFSYAQPPARPIQLWCKRWEQAWNHPAVVWLENIVGASPWPEGTLSWPRAVGTWVHRWLASALHEGQEKKSAPPELPVLLWAAADREASALRKRAHEVGKPLYPWWDQVWAQARTVALGLAEALVPHLDNHHFLCEFRLPDNLLVALPGTNQPDFVLKGRIDLLLIEPGLIPYDLASADFSGCACWIIDFKTGSASSLSAKKIDEGKGLQPVLYGLAIRALSAASTTISLQTPDAPLQPQVRLDTALETTSIFRSLDKLHREGVFGMRADSDNAYGYSPAYPMATRFVPSDILETKWELVHRMAMGESA